MTVPNDRVALMTQATQVADNISKSQIQSTRHYVDSQQQPAGKQLRHTIECCLRGQVKWQGGEKGYEITGNQGR